MRLTCNTIWQKLHTTSTSRSCIETNTGWCTLCVVKYEPVEGFVEVGGAVMLIAHFSAFSAKFLMITPCSLGPAESIIAPSRAGQFDKSRRQDQPRLCPNILTVSALYCMGNTAATFALTSDLTCTYLTPPSLPFTFARNHHTAPSCLSTSLFARSQNWHPLDNFADHHK